MTACSKPDRSTFPPGETSPQVFLASQIRDGVFTVRLTAKDDLAADNQASIVSLLPKPVKVLLVSRGNRLLEKALRAAANVELSHRQRSDGPGGRSSISSCSTTLSRRLAARAMCSRFMSSTRIGSRASRGSRPRRSWIGNPLIRCCATPVSTTCRSCASLTAKTPTWAVSLVDAPQAPLMLAGELGRQRIIWIGFDVLESNWPLRVSFPIFIANAVEWLNPANAKGGQLLVKAGDAFRLALAHPEKSAQVTLPDGAIRTLTIDPNANEMVFGDTYKQGVYRLRLGTNETAFCVDLLDAAESNIKPRDELQLGKYTRVTATPCSAPIWNCGAPSPLSASSMLMVEWWYYHRRTA